MGRRKLWFERDNYFIHYTEKYRLTHNAESGWQLVSDNTVIYKWSPRKKNPPLTEANKQIKNFESPQMQAAPMNTDTNTNTASNIEVIDGSFEADV